MELSAMRVRSRPVVGALAGLASAAVLAAGGCAASGAAGAAGAAGTTGAAGATGATGGEASPRVERQAPAQALVEPADGDNPRTGPADAKVGETYPFDLFTQCGIDFAEFDGRTWRAEAPLPAPAPKANPDGVMAFTGYTAGTMTLMDDSTAYFLADLRYTDLAEPLVVFTPASGEPEACR
jgi:hypothetical protein